jgi:hypothetical protein
VPRVCAAGLAPRRAVLHVSLGRCVPHAGRPRPAPLHERRHRRQGGPHGYFRHDRHRRCVCGARARMHGIAPPAPSVVVPSANTCPDACLHHPWALWPPRVCPLPRALTPTRVHAPMACHGCCEVAVGVSKGGSGREEPPMLPVCDVKPRRAGARPLPNCRVTAPGAEGTPPARTMSVQAMDLRARTPAAGGLVPGGVVGT